MSIESGSSYSFMEMLLLMLPIPMIIRIFVVLM